MENTTILEGTIVVKPTLRITRGGVHVSNFPLLVEDIETNNNFVICITAWGKTAKDCATMFPKGSQIRVNGKLGRSQNTNEMEVHAGNVTFIN